MLNKRGQGLQVSTIILVVLGVAVLVLLAIGFIIGWQKILPWLSTNNVETIVSQCQAACATNSAYGFCTASKTLKAEDLPLVNGQTVKEVSGTCKYFATTADFSKYAVSDCPGLCS